MAAKSFVLILSEHIIEELERILGQDRYFAQRTSPSLVAAITSSLRVHAEITDLTVPVTGVATQPKDDLILATALSGNATILCTRDRQLLKLRAYRTVSILSPGEFRTYLEHET